MAGTWGNTLIEFNAEEQKGGERVFWARVLSSKIDALVQATERPFIIYGTAFLVV